LFSKKEKERDRDEEARHTLTASGSMKKKKKGRRILKHKDDRIIYKIPLTLLNVSLEWS
jgi:hypothetical protein